MEQKGNERKEKKVGFFISTLKNKFGEIKNFHQSKETEKALQFSYTANIKGVETEINFWIPKSQVYKQTEKTLGIGRKWVPDALVNNLVVGVNQNSARACRDNMKSNQHKITSLMKTLQHAKSRRQARLVRGKLLKLINHLSPKLKESCIRHWDRLVSSKYLPY